MNMGLGKIGDFKWPKKKWRWLIEFINDGVSAEEPKFVKIYARPAPPIPYPKGTKFEMNFSNLWLPKGSALAPFNEVILKLVDSDAIVLEKWNLKEAKLLKLENEVLDDEEVFSGIITYTDVEYKCNVN